MSRRQSGFLSLSLSHSDKDSPALSQPGAWSAPSPARPGELFVSIHEFAAPGRQTASWLPLRETEREAQQSLGWCHLGMAARSKSQGRQSQEQEGETEQGVGRAEAAQCQRCGTLAWSTGGNTGPSWVARGIPRERRPLQACTCGCRPSPTPFLWLLEPSLPTGLLRAHMSKAETTPIVPPPRKLTGKKVHRTQTL